MEILFPIPLFSAQTDFHFELPTASYSKKQIYTQSKTNLPVICIWSLPMLRSGGERNYITTHCGVVDNTSMTL